MVRLNLLAIVSLLLAITISCYAQRVSYSGFTLLRAQPQKVNQVHDLKKLMDSQVGVDFWIPPTRVNQSVDIMIEPGKKTEILEYLNKHNIPSKEVMRDIEDAVRESRRRIPMNRQYVNNGTYDPFFVKYQTYADMERRLDLIARNPNVQRTIIGKSSEGRNLHMIKYSTDFDRLRPVILIDGGHHAREWISPATVFYLMDAMTRQTNNPLKEMAKKFDFWFVPVINPDGYVYSHLYDRLWRKTRSKNQVCRGVDPNRNYDYHWNEVGASRYECDDIYSGKSANSEPEVAALAKVLDENNDRIKMYITLHSYSQFIIFPFGSGKTRSKMEKSLRYVAQAGAKGYETFRGTKFRVGTAPDVLYPASGGSDDYAHGKALIPYSFTIELPDKGRYGFLLPPREIIPVGRESLHGITGMIEGMSQLEFRKGR